MTQYKNKINKCINTIWANVPPKSYVPRNPASHRKTNQLIICDPKRRNPQTSAERWPKMGQDKVTASRRAIIIFISWSPMYKLFFVWSHVSVFWDWSWAVQCFCFTVVLQALTTTEDTRQRKSTLLTLQLTLNKLFFSRPSCF